MTEPTHDELAKLFTEETGFDVDDFPAAILDFARTVLAKWGAQPVPAGYSLVPVEPSAEMVDAAQEAYMPFGDMQLAIQLAIAAAPQPVARKPLTDEQIDQAIAELGLNYLADAHATNRAVLRKLCRHAHGITEAVRVRLEGTP